MSSGNSMRRGVKRWKAGGQLLMALLLTSFFSSGCLPSALAKSVEPHSEQTARLFSGITALEAGLDSVSGQAVLTFGADLPFHYQMQILGSDQVLFRLYHARLAQELRGPEGLLALKSPDSTWSARLKEHSASGDYQEFILSAPSLGAKKIRVVGATELPLGLPAPAKSVSKAAVSRELTPKPLHARQIGATELPLGLPRPAKSVSRAVSRAFTAKQSPARQVVAHQSAHAASSQRMPRILSVNDASTSARIQAPSQRYESLYRLSLQSPRLPNPSSGQSPAPKAARLPIAITANGEKLRPLPSYTGGAKPILAMTLDEDGRPLIVRPKNMPLPEFNLSAGNGDAFNALFQADEPVSDQAGRLLSDALSAYRAREYRQALGLIEQAVRLKSDNPDLQAARGEIHWAIKQKEVALEAYRQAVNLSPGRYEPRYAQILSASGKTPEAIRVLEAYDREHPGEAPVVYMLGGLYEESGRLEQGLSRLKQAAQLDPDSMEMQYHLGLAYELRGDLPEAKRHYDRALKLSPDADNIRSALARVSDNGKL